MPDERIITANEATLPPFPLCDRGEVGKPCGETAVFSYLWEWGEKGTCCAVHGQLLQQIAGQLSRSVMLIPFQVATAAPPLTRDERVRLNAEILARDAELEESRARGLELYRANNDLARQVQLMSVREREAAAQLKDSLQKQATLQVELDDRDVEHAQIVAELERLRTLAAFVDPQLKQQQRFGAPPEPPSQNVVQGGPPPSDDWTGDPQSR